MSSQDTKKAKRRKLKKLYNLGQDSSVALQNELPESTRCNETEDLKEIEKFMDAPYDCDSPMPPLSRGPNPYLGGERCLLCRCERPDPPNASKIKEEADDKNKSEDASTLSALPLWVCPNCRRSVEEVEKKSGYSLDTSLLDQEFTVDSTTLPFLSDMNLGTVPSGESGSVNGSVCTCEACTERRQIEAEHERETQELQKCWMELRKAVWLIYYRNGEPEEEGLNPTDPELTMPEESRITELVHRLCSRDPHQLFRRLESQARELVLEKKVNLLHQLTSGHKTVAEARDFVGRLLEEYSLLCKAARKLAGLLQELEQDHLKKFNVTWELHNKHLFQSIAYTDPMVQKSLSTLLKQLRQGAASKETYHDDRYPNLLQRYHKLDEEMSVVTVVWRDCQLLIEQYNEEQEASKVKQKMLKEDWMFFKQQRKLLEQQVLKRSSNQTATQLLECTAGLEAHFTETMRHLLQGTKPSPEECHCPRCNWKRCPCDECTIMHMITCGIINPDSVDNNPTQAPNFNHDSSSYLDDVTPPSMSSTSSSSGQSSPLMVDPERLALHLTDCQKDSVKEDDEEAEEVSQSEEEEEEDDDEEDEEEDYDEEEEDDDEEDEEEEDDEELDEDEDEEADEENSTLQASEFPLPISSELPPLTAAEYPQPLSQQAIPLHPNMMQGWSQDQLDTSATTDAVNKVTNCDCHHCVSQAKAQQVPQEEGQCQCHVCLQQRGKIVSTTLPQHLPAAPRPELHLYPHIHGHTGHVRPLLQPHLYDLHMPMRQPKPVVPPAKVPLKLDFDTPEGLQEHMYHAYGEWDNTYNVHRMLDSHKFGAGLNTELLPPPPLPTGSFISETLSMDGSAFINPVNTSSISSHSPATSMMVPSRPFDVQSSTITTAMSQPPAAQTESCQKATVRRANRNTTNNKHQVISQGQSNGQVPLSLQSPPVTRPATMGGNSAIQPPGEKIQRCKHLSSQSKLSMSQQHVNHSVMTAGGHPPNRNPSDLPRGSVPRKDDGGKLTMGSNANLNPPHSCNHGHSRSPGHLHQQGPLPHSGGCSNALPQTANGSNVSVGTSTICTDPDCETNHDDNYDSIDDSGSEQSSSTSTSNQKEGKYCDCCYCEFFGHSNPPSLPTSKNYAEMRDRLRLRLKRKNEAKQDDMPKPMNSVCTASSKSKDPLDVKGLDELLKFINGVEDPKDKQLSAKAAKRARQKQRKAEERARKIEEERQKLRQAEKAKKEAAKHNCSAESKCKSSRHRSHKEVVLERFLEGGESPGPQRKKKKARVRTAVVQDDQAGNKTPQLHVKSLSIRESTAEINTTSSFTTPSINKIVNAAGREIKTATRHQASKTNHVISDKRSALSSTTPKAVSHENSKAKPKEETAKIMTESLTSARVDPVANPASPKQVLRRNTTRKVNPVNPATSIAQPSVPVSFFPTTVTNGSPRTSPQPDKTSQVTANNAKKGSKKPTGQVQQNNLNNLNGGPQPPVNQTRNGLLIQQPANCQINGQKWPVNPKEKVKQNAPAVSKPAAQPVKPAPAVRAEPSPPKARPDENGVHNSTEQNLRSAEQSLRNQEQNKLLTGKNKKKNKKNRNNEDINHIDEIFMPRTDSDLEGGEMDDFERELEEFKRFCFDSTPAPRQKLQVNVNLKDIFAKKKSGLGCS